jgi:hypothetical protein
VISISSFLSNTYYHHDDSIIETLLILKESTKEFYTKTNDFLIDIIFSNYDAKSIKEKIKLFKEEVL